MFQKWTVFMFTESWSRDQVMQRAHLFGERKASFGGHIKLSFKRNSKNSNTRNHAELKIDVRFDKNHLHYNHIDWLNFSIRVQILFNFSWRKRAIIGRPVGASEVQKRKWSGVFY